MLGKRKKPSGFWSFNSLTSSSLFLPLRKIFKLKSLKLKKVKSKTSPTVGSLIENNFVGLLITFILLVGVISGVVLVRRYQSLKSKAAPLTTISQRVLQGSDDAQERASGSMYIDSSDLELVDDGDKQQLVGIRFQNINIPNNAIISKAYIEFEADEADSKDTSLVIKGEGSDNATTFSKDDNISSRPVTQTSVEWSNIVSWSKNVKYQTPDLSDVVQEIVSRPGWNSGSSMAFIFSISPPLTRSVILRASILLTFPA